MLLTPTEVAERLKVNVRYVYDLINTGKLPALRLGHRTLRVKHEDLEGFIAKQTSHAVS